jgi:hypothetical protein
VVVRRRAWATPAGVRRRLTGIVTGQPLEPPLVTPPETGGALGDRGRRERPGRNAGRWNHAYAVDGAGRNAQLATRAFGGNDGVHALARAHDGVGRAGGQAARAADAGRLVDPCNQWGSFRAAAGIERQRGPAEQGGEFADQGASARRAAVERGFSARERVRVGPAGVESAAAALRLRQSRVDARGKFLRRGHGAPS